MNEHVKKDNSWREDVLKIINLLLYSIPLVISNLRKDIRLNALFIVEGKPNCKIDNVFIRRAQPIRSKG